MIISLQVTQEAYARVLVTAAVVTVIVESVSPDLVPC